MLASVILKSQLEGARRLDAEYYQPEYFIDFSKGDWRRIGDCLIKCQYGLSLVMNDEGVGYPMFKMDDIDHGFVLDDKVRFAEVSDNEFADFKIKKDDVFFNRVNSVEFVGRTGILKLKADAVFASYLIRLQTKKDILFPDYLNTFLNSEYGRKQINKYARRAVNQANVNAEELKEMRIRIPSVQFQMEIERFSNEAWENFENSKSLYTQAENLLLEELDLKDFEVEERLYSVAKLSDVKSADRMDAEYFQVKYEKLTSKMKKIQPLASVIENVPAKFDPSEKPDKQFRYVELADIHQSIGVIDGFSEIFGKEAPSRAKRVLKEGDVIVSSVEGSLQKVALVDKERANYLASTGFFQFRSDSILPEALLVLAKSIVFQMQLERLCAGTILTAVPKESVNNIVVPVLSKSTQQKIADLVRQSHEARKKANELLEEAKRKVEEMIENQ